MMMYCEPKEYFSYTIIFVLFAGLFLLKYKMRMPKKTVPSFLNIVPLLILLVFPIRQISVIALLSLSVLILKSHRNRMGKVAVWIYLLYEAYVHTMYGTVINLGILLYFARLRSYKVSLTGAVKLAIICLVILSIQKVKLVERNSINDKISLVSNEVISRTVLRLNQGWITSLVVSNTSVEDEVLPNYLKDLVSIPIPRILNPNKREAGGRELFTQLTGESIGETTSMGVGVLGESIGFMRNLFWLYILGFLISFRLIASFLAHVTYRINAHEFILPAIWINAMKIETESYVVFNWLWSGILFCLLFVFIQKVLTPWHK